jgi:hypothetical protein
MSTISRPRLKPQTVIDRCQVEIVDLTGTYVRNAGIKSAAILDGAELCRVEEFDTPPACLCTGCMTRFAETRRVWERIAQGYERMAMLRRCSC